MYAFIGGGHHPHIYWSKLTVIGLVESHHSHIYQSKLTFISLVGGHGAMDDHHFHFFQLGQVGRVALGDVK